ncbi:MAG TPA: M6 family metalloprotease domain-containing protein [Bacteroidales bacterium]|nr:M6 family metalloprotease domain-containing protein [Bacteroidales bacterium]
MNLKRGVLLLLILFTTLSAGAAWFSYMPYQVSQPDGSTISCYVSGDEYFNWLHDQEGHTIIQAEDGFFYYAQKSGDQVVPTAYRVGTVDPAQLSLEKWVKISPSEYQKRRDFFTRDIDRSVKAPHDGTLNNLVIYIRFNDDTEFPTPRQNFDNLFNPETGNTLKSYYRDVSYDLLTISSSHYPACDMSVSLSYKDTHNRGYFQPYNATTNPSGYSNDEQRRIREHNLLKDAVNWINANSPVPGDLNIDGDNDGSVDNVCFIIRGVNGAWAELLWAHRWVLSSYYVYINGKRVYDYTFQPETQVAVNTLCHEMFHALGAPDLYHYTDNGIDPVGAWDLMQSGSGHMGAYMKWKYTNQTWITDIPVITTSGEYTLHPLRAGYNTSYKIPSPNSETQFFIVEYRKKQGTFEGTLPGSGLLVYRIDTLNGNAGGPPDEVYLFRPGGSLTENGSPGLAHFSAESGRTEMNDNTNPSSFLQDGSPGGLVFMNVTSADTTISFTVNVTNIKDPASFRTEAVSTSEILLHWQNNPETDQVIIAFDTLPVTGMPVNGMTYQPGDLLPGGGTVIYTGNVDTLFIHQGLTVNTHYYYKAWSMITAMNYSFGITADAFTLCNPLTNLPFAEGFENSDQVPSCWSQENTEPLWIFCQGNGAGSGGGFPEEAHTGLRNACLKDITTAPHKNKLILPMMDLTAYSVAELRFWLFMQRWGTRQDELTVFYRTAPTAAWIPLQTYNTSITAWTEEVITLPEITNQVQIAFEGNARFGFGVCIDDILIDGNIVSTAEKKPAKIWITPNPGKDFFTIRSDREEIREIDLYDVTGKLLFRRSDINSPEQRLDLTGKEGGLYFVRITLSDEVILRKVTLLP